VEPIHIKIELAFDLKNESAQGKVTTTMKGNRAGVTTVKLNACEFMDVTVSDAKGLAVTSSYDGRMLEAQWQKPFAKDETRELVVSYRIESPVGGLYFMQPTEAYPKKALYAATDHETEKARYWLPCIDLPNVRTTLEFHLTAAKELTILANGALVKEVVNADGTKTAQWQLQQRCPSYLVCIAIGDFVKFDDGTFEGVPVAYFTSKDFTPEDLKRSFGRTSEMLAWMTKKLDFKFPFPKYFQFALPQFGGAMENISLVSWSDNFVLDERLAKEMTWLVDQVNIHEMAHSYFGDLVVCRDFAHAWLKESWATYMETCWLEDKRGEDEQFYDLYRNSVAYFTEADERYARPLVIREFTSSWQMYDRHLYPGGACRLHTLRKELGDEVFWTAVRDYLKTYQFKTVETDDFRRVLEKHSGRSLQKFFDQWVFSPSYPAIKVTFTYDKEKAIGTFEICQKQVDAAKKILPFEFTTDLGWSLSGKDYTQEVHISKDRQSFTIAMTEEPEQVRFDPKWRVLHKLEFKPGDDKLKKQMTGAKDIVGRIQAALALGASGKRASLQEIVKAYKAEKFWGVRREMIKALEESNSETGIRGLIEVIGLEKEPLVLDRVFEGAANYRDDRIIKAIKERLSRSDLGPLALAAAYRALGKQRHKAPVELLTLAASKPVTHHGIEQAAALTALGDCRIEDNTSFLLNKVEYGQASYRIRHGAVRGLGLLASYVDKAKQKQIEECLIDLTRDPEPWLRLTAASSLKEAHCKSGIAALEALRSMLPLQEQVSIDELIKALQKSDDSRVQAVEKRLDKMQEKFRKITERLQDLEDK
jgi:aminopeptidase N